MRQTQRETQKELTVREVGGTLVVTLPRAIDGNFKKGDRVVIDFSHPKRLVIVPAPKRRKVPLGQI